MFLSPTKATLCSASRLTGVLGHGLDRVRLTEMLLLCGLGVSAGLVRCLVRTHLHLPGHSILFIVLPTAAGVAISRRQGAGTAIGLSALGTGAFLNCFCPVKPIGIGALTSLAATGVFLDVALAWARRPAHVYFACIVAACGSSALAFAVRAVTKQLGLQPGYHPAARMAIWAPRAMVTYLICGLVAGLLSAFVCFRWREEEPQA
jgi:hypothetical protein